MLPNESIWNIWLDKIYETLLIVESVLSLIYTNDRKKCFLYMYKENIYIMLDM